MRPVGPERTRAAGAPGPGPANGGRDTSGPQHPEGPHRPVAPPSRSSPAAFPRAAAGSGTPGSEPAGEQPTERLRPAHDRIRRNTIAEQRTEYLPAVGLRGPGEQPPPPPHRPGDTDGDDDDGGNHGNGGIGDGLALSLCSAFGSVAGLLVVLISTRIMPQEEVGKASEFVSAMQLIGGAAQLNLGIGLMRWLPGAGRRSVRLVFGSLLLIMPLSGLLGLVYAVIVPSIADTAGGGSFGWGLLLFVLACAGWGVFVVHDFVMVAIGRPWVAVWRNGTFAVVRIGLLFVLGSAFAAQGLILSWAVPVVLWVAVGTVMLWFMTRRFAATGGPGVLPARSTMVAFLAPTALAQMGNAALYNQVPLLANLQMGNEIGAVFFIIWQAVTVVDMAATFFTNSLAVQTAREPHRAEELARLARRRMLLLFVPVLALGAALGYPVLSVLGAGYTAGAPALAVLMVGLLFRLIVVFELARRQADGDGMGYAKLQLLNTGLVVGFAFVVPLPDPATTPMSLVMLPFVLGYLGAQVLCALGLKFLPAWQRRSPSEVKS
ncbi:lipopolysaccharide biosynthesis protein [Pseudonocardia nantongensis]|uniref:lipopolysaccharide biosynthesis protein n=1 Tax=Pseudonocardia nantongensis TaxID=1181885 RepID=UPI00397C1B22